MTHERHDLPGMGGLPEPGAKGMSERVPDVILRNAGLLPNLFESCVQLIFVGPVVPEEVRLMQAVHHDLFDRGMQGDVADVLALGHQRGLTADPYLGTCHVDVVGAELEQLALADAGVSGEQDRVGQVLAVVNVHRDLGHERYLLLGEVGEPVLAFLRPLELGADLRVESSQVGELHHGRPRTDDSVDG